MSSMKIKSEGYRHRKRTLRAARNYENAVTAACVKFGRFLLRNPDECKKRRLPKWYAQTLSVAHYPEAESATS